MVKLPVISGRDVVRVLGRVGYREPPFRRITVPDHKEVAKGTSRAILRQTGLSSAELAAFLK